MIVGSRLGELVKSGICLLAILAFWSVLSPRARAQAPVPSAYQDLYPELQNYLTNFNAQIGTGNGSTYPTVLAGSLKIANSNAGPALLNGTQGMQLQINALKAMGAQAIMVQIGFPILDQDFLTSQSQSYSAWTAYYQAMANSIRSAGMKLIIENDTLLTNSVSAGWDVAPFYQGLNWPTYQQKRANMAAWIAQNMQPDYMVVIEEPDLETANSGQTNLSTPSLSAAMLSLILTTVQQAGVPNVKIGAGVGCWQQNGLSFIQNYVTLPVDFIDIHIYPVNDQYLQIALQMASTAAAAGKPVSMTECWLWKVRDSELFQTLTSDQIRARNPFSFWAPLDALFIQTMLNLANYTQMLFIDPFNAELYFSYMSYDDSTDNMTPAQIQSAENALESAAQQQAQFSSTGMAFYNSVVAPADTTPPSAPSGLTGVSGNPTTTYFSWSPSTDNIGVAGYYVYRNGRPIATTATLAYQDNTGLSEATTYTYTIQAFDLGGNLSALSAPLNITTTDVSPPTTPQNVTGKAVACNKATFTWSPSQDNSGVTQYIVYLGLSPSTLVQMAYVGTRTSFSFISLSPATTYYFGVEAQDKNQNISYMSPVAPVTTPAMPVPPGSLLAKVSSTTKITLSWAPSAAPGGLPIAHYIVYRGLSPSSLSQLAITAKTMYTDLSGSATTTYYYAVAAADTGAPPAQSGLSSPISATTFSPPSVPAGLTANPESCTKIGLTWSPSTSGGLSIANYRVWKGTSPSNLTQIAITSKTVYTDTTDLDQTKYYYAVQAADTGAPPDLSAISTPVPVTTYGDPSVPGNVTVTPVSSTKVTVTWSASTSGGLPISNYHVYRGTSLSTLSQVGIATGTSYSNGSLTAGTGYYYAVLATDTALDSSALSPAVPVTTFPLPSAPSNVSAQSPSSTQIALSWSPSTGSLPIARYFVLRGSSPSISSMSQVAVTTKLAYTDRTVSPGTTYYYAVQAADTAVPADLSGFSTPVAATTQP